MANAPISEPNPNDLDQRLFQQLLSEIPDLEEVRLLMERGADINSPTCCGETVLITAITNIQDGLPVGNVKLILELGADPNWDDGDGGRALLDACLGGRPEVVEMLLHYGADPTFVVNRDRNWSLLDYVEVDAEYETNHNCGDHADRLAAAYPKIIAMLKTSGATSFCNPNHQQETN
jgi:ankyrin repeat protein